MSLLTVSNLSVALGRRDVLRDVSFSIEEGEFVGLIGPNGAGKTTLMRAALGLIPCQGQSTLAQMPLAARGRQAAWMPQAREIAWPVTVETVVMLGRLPHISAYRKADAEDRARVDEAMDRMELTALRHRPATQLSGGEQARVLIGRTLAQQTPLILADEPIAGLDPAHQIATMETFRGLAGQGISSLMSLHDLGLAARHCTRLIMLGAGRLIADGTPEAVLTADRVAEVFGISAWSKRSEKGLLYVPLEVIA